MAKVNNTDVNIRDRELVLTRIFDAPRALVYKVWTDPAHVSKWWGPRVFTNPVCEIDFRPGGGYRFVMRSPGGDEFPMSGTYIEMVENERIVCTDDMFKQREMWEQMIGSSVGPDVDFTNLHNIVTAVFEDHEGKTKLTLTTRFVSNEVRDALVKMQMAEGWTESFGKLDEVLQKA